MTYGLTYGSSLDMLYNPEKETPLTVYYKWKNDKLSDQPNKIQRINSKWEITYFLFLNAISQIL